MSTLAVNAITNASGGNTATINGMTPTATSLQGFRNRIINGGMTIAQRATSSSTQGYSTVDRFYVNRTGSVAGISMAQVYGAFSSNKYCLTVQRDAGNTSTAAANIYQAIEGINCRDIAGQSATVSFLIGTGTTISATSGHSIQLFYQTTTTDAGPTTGSWTQIAAPSFTVTGSTAFTQKTATFSVPSNATQLMLVISFAFSGTAGADDRYYITEVQLEVGSVVTNFEQRDYGRELMMCQRYCYAQVNPSGNSYWYFGIGIFSNGSTSQAYGHSIFPTTMRVEPTVTVSAANTFWIDPGTTNFTAVGLDQASTDSASLIFTGGSGGAVGGGRWLSDNIDAAYVIWSAEL